MKNPKINIFGKTHPVRLIDFDGEGNILKVSYLDDHRQSNTLFRDSRIDCYITNTHKDISEPTRHPWHNWTLAPNLNSLLTWEEDKG